jgi:hypothetical protein
MTLEELDRTIEFIVQSQARLAANQEEERRDRLTSEKELKGFDRRLARLFEMLVGLQRDQTERLNRFEEEMRETRTWQRAFQIETIGRLDRILGKLTDRLN